MANKRPAKKQTLDERLVALINTEKKWQLFANEILHPLLPDESCPGKRLGFPTEDPVDRVNPLSMTAGSYFHMRAIANALHMGAVLNKFDRNNNGSNGNSDDGTSSDDNGKTVYEIVYENFFDREHKVSEFRSMTAPPDLDMVDCGASLQQMWLDGVSFPFTHNLTSAVEQVTQDRLYVWSTGSTRDNWLKKFCPLTYYKWNVPNSAVSSWRFLLDPNSVFIFNWYQFYLTRIESLREVYDQYAAALKQQRDLQNTKQKLSQQFIEKNQRVQENMRAREVNLNKLAAPDRDKTKRFLISLDKLYTEFTKTLPRQIIPKE